MLEWKIVKNLKHTSKILKMLNYLIEMDFL